MPFVVVLFFCSGLWVYWIARTILLLRGAETAIDETLDCDYWWGRRFLLAVRSAFEPPNQLIG